MKRDELQLGAEVWVRRSSYSEYAVTVAALEPWLDRGYSYNEKQGIQLPDGRVVPPSMWPDNRSSSNGQGVLVTAGAQQVFRVVQLRQIIGLAAPIREAQEREEAAKTEKYRQYQARQRAAEEMFLGTADQRKALDIDSAYLEYGEAPTVRVELTQFVSLVQTAAAGMLQVAELAGKL